MANVRVKNKLAQLLAISTAPGGQLTEIKLGPRAVSDPIDEADLGERTKRLAKLGHVTIISA